MQKESIFEAVKRMSQTNPDEIVSFLDDTRAWVEQIANDSDCIVPYLLIRSIAKPDELEIHAINMPFNEHEEKQHVMRTIARSLHERKVIPKISCLVSEAWFVERKFSKGEVPRDLPEPRHDPDRVECALVHALPIDGSRGFMDRAEIKRDSKGNIKLRKWKGVKSTPSSHCQLLRSLFVHLYESVREKLDENRNAQ